MLRSILNLIFVVFLFFTTIFFCYAQETKKIKHKTLSEILEKYSQQGFSIVGPVQIENITHAYIKCYEFKKIRKKNVKIINKKGKPVPLCKNDWVYVLEKEDKTIIIKIPKEKIKMEKNE